MNRARALSICLSFLAGIAVAVIGPLLIRAAAGRLLFPEKRTEVARVVSPDGVVDAVAQHIECGAPCSSGYSITVVPRGGAVPADPDKQMFLADDVANPRILWKESHLLDIAYDKALIQSFRNVTYPLGKSGNVESWRYAVEAHLSPSSAGFSYLGNSTEPKTSR